MKKLGDYFNGRGDSLHSKKSKFGSSDTFDFLSLIRNWERIIGVQLAKHTSPLKIQYKTLIILTRHSVYSQQLSYLSEDIRKKIYSHYPSLRKSVHKLKFHTSERMFLDLEKDLFSPETLEVNNKKKHKYSPLYKQKRLEAMTKYEDIGLDEELLELIISIDIQNSEENS